MPRTADARPGPPSPFPCSRKITSARRTFFQELFNFESSEAAAAGTKAGEGWDPYSTVLLPNQPLVWIDQKLRRPTDVHSIASDVVRRIRQQLTASLSPSTSPSLPLHPHSDCFSLRIFSYLLSPLFGPHSPPRHAICSLLFFFLPPILILHSFPSSTPSSSTPPLSVLLLFLFLLLLLHIIISGRWATPVVCRQRAGRERMSKASCLVLRHSALVSLWHWLSIKH